MAIAEIIPTENLREKRSSFKTKSWSLNLIRETSFWCGTCGKNIVVKVYCDDNSNAVSEKEEKKALDLISLYHQIEIHTMCWKCGRQIKSHQIAGMNRVDQRVWENLCGDCV